MKKVFAVLMVVVLCSSTVFSAPLQENLLPKNVSWVVHLDLDAVKGTSIYQMVTDHLEGEGKMAEINMHLDQLEQKLGINLLNDLRSVTLYNCNFSDKEGVALFSGDFSRQKLEEIVTGEQDHQQYPHGGCTIHQCRF